MTVAANALNKWRKSTPVSTLLNVTLLLWVIAIPAWWIQGGYRDVAITEVFTFRVADGGCDIATEALGPHCFSDYYSPMKSLSEGELLSRGYVKPILYPPSALPPFLATNALQNLFDWGPRVGLVAYLLAGMVAVCIPALYALRFAPPGRRLLALLLLGPASLPALMVFDRANSVMFTIPFLLAFGVLSREHRYRAASLFLAFAVAQRPQFVLLYLAFVALRQWRALVTGLAMSTALMGAGFLLWPGNRVENVRNWLSAVTSYKEFHSIAYDWPANLSAARAMYQLTQIFGVDVRIPSITGIGFVAAVAVTCAFKGRQLDHLSLFTLAVFSAVLMPDVSFVYYLTLVLPIGAVLLTSRDVAQSFEHWVTGQAIAIAVALSIVPLPFAGFERAAVVTPHFSAIVWLATCGIILVTAWFPRRHASTPL